MKTFLDTVLGSAGRVVFWADGKYFMGRPAAGLSADQILIVDTDRDHDVGPCGALVIPLYRDVMVFGDRAAVRSFRCWVDGQDTLLTLCAGCGSLGRWFATDRRLVPSNCRVCGEVASGLCFSGHAYGRCLYCPAADAAATKGGAPSPAQGLPGGVA